MCIDMCIAASTNARKGMFTDSWLEACMRMRIGMCSQICAGTCVDVCVHMSVSMCMAGCIDRTMVKGSH